MRTKKSLTTLFKYNFLDEEEDIKTSLVVKRAKDNLTLVKDRAYELNKILINLIYKNEEQKFIANYFLAN